MSLLCEEKENEEEDKTFGGDDDDFGGKSIDIFQVHLTALRIFRLISDIKTDAYPLVHMYY